MKGPTGVGRRRRLIFLSVSRAAHLILFQETSAYSEMLVMQRSMMRLRNRYIKSKLQTELLKQAVLKNCLAEKGLEIPLLEVSDYDSNDEEEDEEDNNNIFN